MTMTSTLLQRPVSRTKITIKTTVEKQAPNSTSRSTMAWSHEKLRIACIDNIGFRQLWKLTALNTAEANSSQHSNMSENMEQPKIISSSNNNNYNERLADNLIFQRAEQTRREETTPMNQQRKSLLKFLAINALELSAPATPLLLQQQQQHKQARPLGWMQLSGHPESIVPTSTGIVRKRITGIDDCEAHAYQLISQESKTSQIVPSYFGLRELQTQHFIELQDLLVGFKDPCVMDIKLGSRTFLETEVNNKTLRPDLYQKMIAVDASAPTQVEHEAQAINKLRYMLFRESLSSSHTKGFRIEALRLRGSPPLKDLKTCRSSEQISQTIQQFLAARRSVQKELLKRLKHIRLVIEQSAFFNRHEIVGSSIFIVYDDHRMGAWVIDFAKSRQLPPHLSVNHRSPWIPGNREEGLLSGIDELIHAFEEVYARSSSHRGCLKV